MPGVVHVVVTNKFAGVERYISSAAQELACRGWVVSVVGGDPRGMPAALGAGVRWLPGATPGQALRSLVRLGHVDVCHAHMTLAEAVAAAGQWIHRSPIVSTRHFAARRGSSRLARIIAPAVARRLAREIAVSDYVALRMERSPEAVIVNGVPASPILWSPASRVVLVLQRLEREKDTLTALRAWQASHLSEVGWSLRVVGDGSQRSMLEEWVGTEGVEGVAFVGRVRDVGPEFARAGILLAPAPADSVGLSVLEAMAAGVPVVACGSGGHVETVGRLPGARLFAPSDFNGAAAALRSLLPSREREAFSSAARALVDDEFTVERHVDRLLNEYMHAITLAGRARKTSVGPT